MKNYTKIAAMLIFLVIATSCNTLLGPPGSESELTLPFPADSFPYDRLIEGQPNLNLLAVQGGIYIWKTGDNWHVRIAKVAHPPVPALREPVFTGNMHIENGLVVNVVKYNLNIRNDVNFRMNDIFFRIEPENTIEGFDFQIKPTSISYCTMLDFRINGAMIPDTVHLGNSMFIPKGLPLTICFY